MSGWIKIEKDLPESIRFRRVVRKVKERNALPGVTDRDDAFVVTLCLGAINRLWAYADSHITDDNTIDGSFGEIDDLVGVPGFAESLPDDWLRDAGEGRMELPDFLEKNGSSAKQRKDGAKRQAEFRHRKKAPESNAAVTRRNARNDARPDQTRPDVDQTREEPKPVAAATGGVPREEIGGESVARVFGHWQSAWGKPRAQLDAKRRRVIREALAKYSEADVCQAISGYRNSPHHTGNNERRTVYDDIELFLRDAKHIDAGLNFYANPPRTDLSDKTRRIIDQTESWVPPEMRNAAN